MFFGIKEIVSFSAIIALKSKAVNSLSFCQSFADNNNDIDYGYQVNEAGHYYLFIGHNYWQLLVNESTQTVQLLLESRQSDWFGNEYRMAIRGDFYDQNNTLITMAGLVMENYSIDWALVSVDPDTDNLIVADNGRKRTIQFTIEPDFKPSIGFDYGVFIEQVPLINSTHVQYLRSFRSLNFDARTFEASNDTGFFERLKGKMDMANITYGSDETIIDNIRDRYKAMAVFTTSKGIFFLLSDRTTILYCFANQYFATLGCYTQPQILVDCRQPDNDNSDDSHLLESGP